MLTREGWLKHWQMAVGQSLKAYLTQWRGEGESTWNHRENALRAETFRGFQVLTRVYLCHPCVPPRPFLISAFARTSNSLVFF